MPEDRLGDLDPSERRRGAAERLSELDARERGPEGGDDDRPRRPGSRYGWVVGVAFFVLIAYATVSTLQGGTGEGNSGPEPGTELPDFAAPTLSAQTEEGPNIGQSGDVDPCDVEGEGVVNICELREEGPVVLTFVVLGDLSGDVRCEDALDQLERLRRDFPDVGFVGVLSGASPEEVAQVLESHDWSFPVANDPDGVLQSTYRVGDCPVTVLAEEGGEVAETINGFLSLEELKSAVRRVSASPERAAG